ncbi:MAG: PAS domain S-box protein [Dehalococcoidales bacterium]|nr:PAS domain S-box protein [Dehalococcoidales bacterium]
MKSTFRLSEKDYRYLFENSVDAMWVHDLEGNYIDANKAFERLSGRSIEEWSHSKVTEFITSETLEKAREIKRKILNNEPFEQPYEQQFIIKDGRVRIFQMSTSPVIIDDEIIGFQHVGRDVTEERYAEELLANIIDGLPIATFVINKDHIVTHWNLAIQRLTGISRKEIIGTGEHWKALNPQKQVTMADLAVDEVSDDEIEKLYRGKCRKSDLFNDILEAEFFYSVSEEKGKWLLINACPLKNKDGQITGAIETLQDLTVQKSLEENIRFYGQMILRAQEDERKRIARELHDDTSSAMLLLLQRLDAAGIDDNNELPSSLKHNLEEIHSEALGVLDSLRRCAQELRPRILDDLGLVAAIEWIAEEIMKKYGVTATVQTIGSEKPISIEYQLLLFRIVQEALSNVRRHAKATKVDLILIFGETAFTVTISDNGTGFNLPDRIEDLAGSGNLGLMGMSERAKLMHGSLNLRSEPGKGTRVTIKIPYETGGRFASLSAIQKYSVLLPFG